MIRTARQPESVFRSSEFRRYYAGQALSYLGDGMRTLVIPLLVFHLTGSAASLGLTFAFELLPFAVFSLLGGSLADRLDRRKLMLGSDAVRFVIMALFTLAVWRGALSLPLLYTGVVLLSICAAIFLGAQASSIPFLLGADRAKAAVAALVASQISIASVASFGPEGIRRRRPNRGPRLRRHPAAGARRHGARLDPGGVIADHWGTRAVMGISGFAFLLLALNLMSSRALLSERR